MTIVITETVMILMKIKEQQRTNTNRKHIQEMSIEMYTLCLGTLKHACIDEIRANASSMNTIFSKFAQFKSVDLYT